MLTNIDRAPLQLDAIKLRGAVGNVEELAAVVRARYEYAMLWQLHKLLGSVECLGNPVGLLSDIGTGVCDFVVQPVHGLADGPDKFVSGLIRGSESLTRHVGGIYSYGPCS